MQRVRRTVVCLAFCIALSSAVSGSASASWLASGFGWGPTTATTASKVAPVVTVTSCTWASSTNTLSVTVSWTKAAYATSAVKRTIGGGALTTIATGQAGGATTGTYVDTGVTHTAPVKGASSTTAAVVYTVANTAGSYWTISGSAASHQFRLTTGNKVPDTCAVL